MEKQNLTAEFVIAPLTGVAFPGRAALAGMLVLAAGAALVFAAHRSAQVAWWLAAAFLLAAALRVGSGVRR